MSDFHFVALMFIYLVCVFLYVSYLYHLMFFLIPCDMMVVNPVNSRKATQIFWIWYPIMPHWKDGPGLGVHLLVLFLGSNKRLQHYDLVIIRTSQDLAPTHNRSILTNTATCCCAHLRSTGDKGDKWGLVRDRLWSPSWGRVLRSGAVQERQCDDSQVIDRHWSGAMVTAGKSMLEWCWGNSQVVDTGVLPWWQPGGRCCSGTVVTARWSMTQWCRGDSQAVDAAVGPWWQQDGQRWSDAVVTARCSMLQWCRGDSRGDSRMVDTAGVPWDSRVADAGEMPCSSWVVDSGHDCIRHTCDLIWMTSQVAYQNAQHGHLNVLR